MDSPVFTLFHYHFFPLLSALQQKKKINLAGDFDEFERELPFRRRRRDRPHVKNRPTLGRQRRDRGHRKRGMWSVRVICARGASPENPQRRRRRDYDGRLLEETKDTPRRPKRWQRHWGPRQWDFANRISVHSVESDEKKKKDTRMTNKIKSPCQSYLNTFLHQWKSQVP